MEQAEVTVEFYGIPRQRAGRSELSVKAGSVAEVLSAVQCACPSLKDLVQPDGRLAPHYLFSSDGRRFVQDVTEAVQPGDRFMLLSADMGG